MDWYKAIDSMQDRGMETASGRQSFLTGMLAGPHPNTDGPSANETVGRFRLFAIGGKSVLAVVAIWLFCYISTIFPYLGTYHYSFVDGVRDEYSVGTRNMLLFKGQTAFIEFETDGADGYEGTVYIDIMPWPGTTKSPNMLALNGEKNGILSVPVETTGIYVFHNRVGSMAYRENLEYRVTWGAK